MAIGNKVIAQSDEQGALPTLYAATQDIPGDSYVGPDGFQEQRGHPTLVGRSAAAQRRGRGRAAVGRFRGADRRRASRSRPPPPSIQGVSEP